MFDSSLGVGVSKAVGGPGYLDFLSELIVTEVVAYRVLIDDIVHITGGLVVLSPSSVGDLQLSALDQLLDLVSLRLRDVVIPIFEEHNFSDEVLPLRDERQGSQHRVEDDFGVPLVHGIQETSRGKTFALEFVIGVEPEGIQMRMKGDQELLILVGTFLSCPLPQQTESQIDPEYEVRSEHLLIQILKFNHLQFTPSQINNFIIMDLDACTESLPIRKISNSTMQFRQLIQSLRTRRQRGEDTVGSRLQPEQKDKESKEDTTVFESEQKTSSQSNNFMMANQSESRLKSKPKCEVGDRDKLRKKQFALNNNPEIEQPVVKESSCSHLEVSIQVEESVTKAKIPLRTSPQKNASTQFDGFQPNSSSQLTSNRDYNKTGQIIKQIVKMQESHDPQPSSSPSKRIRDIPQRMVLEYIEKESKVTEKSDPSEIFTFFSNLCLSCGVVICSPSIKKYKNCIYFGYTISKESSYEGFLYFYDQKIYFGQFLNGFKHGLGVELNIGQHSTAKGEFKDGHKTGKFYLKKPNEKYIGFLENGIYQGEGRLTTEDYVFEGLFEKGQKNGYGEQFYPKTGVKISGMFKNGVLSKQKGSKSIPQIRHKKRIGSENQKQRLAHIRRKSLDKHNQRMSKIRSQSKRQSEYEMEFDTTEDYHEPTQLQFNPSKLEMYRQVPQKLPKICQQLEYSFENGNNFESISSRHETHRRPFPKTRSKREFRLGETSQRETTCQFQQPLPTPCLSMYPRRR